ncbi:protein SUPPRESSOR OF GENE SILENCING 3 homolog isoform X2 [Cryptomeria japonica]|uniref:protein SUPPRESSOR OF GENE SILENCING 3 homolog isoform X2 n=1 Tax=Cryptomeria japonica TaxID=3369 RepID=UPI0027DA76A0|nr:protein SUPPRESSOR OF GENE SILENCING 3 homolog isoform X2 [Cryptomeria japonica]
MTEDSKHCQPSSHGRNYGSGYSIESDQSNPFRESRATGHFRGTHDGNTSKRSGPWHQNQVGPPREFRQGIHDHRSRDSANPYDQISGPCNVQDRKAHNAFSSQRASNAQMASANMDRSGGWLDDDSFVRPENTSHASGYTNSQKHLHSKYHVKDKHQFIERPEQFNRSSYKDNRSLQFQESNTRQNADYSEKYGATSHNSNFRGSADKQISSTNNFKETCYGNVNLTEDEEEEDDDDDDNDSDSEKDLAIKKVHQKLLPKVKEVVDKICGSSKPSLVGNIELSCLVCSPLQYFKGWKAVLAHAQNFRKKKVIQHRGYYLALDSVLKDKEEHGEGQDQEMPSAARSALIDLNLSESHLIVWPPVVVIESSDSKSQLSRGNATSKETHINQGEIKKEDVMIQTLLSQELQGLPYKDIIVCERNRFLILFDASSVGYMEAKVMNDRLREGKRGREDWLRFMDHGDSFLSTKYYGITSLLFGYLAEPADMRVIDPNRTIVKDWSEESYCEKVQSANKRMKQEHAHKQAKLKAMELEVVTLSEEEQNIKIQRKSISWQIQMKAKQIEQQQALTCVMQERFTEEARRLHEMFEAGVSRVDEEGSSIERELREQLERDEKLHEKERNFRMKQIHMRHQALQELKKGNEKLVEEKALARESEIMSKREKFMAAARKAETDFNAEIQRLESSLQAEQQEEMAKLAEESEREKDDFYREWEKENETIRKEFDNLGTNKEQKNEEQIHKENEKAPECAICWECLTSDNRALLTPCGHTQVCVGCAQAVFKTTKECPLCRQKITKKPMQCPMSLLDASLKVDSKKNEEQICTRVFNLLGVSHIRKQSFANPLWSYTSVC